MEWRIADVGEILVVYGSSQKAARVRINSHAEREQTGPFSFGPAHLRSPRHSSGSQYPSIHESRRPAQKYPGVLPPGSTVDGRGEVLTGWEWSGVSHRAHDTPNERHS